MIDTWDYPTEEMEHECNFCGVECEGEYCSRQCRRAYESEN